jgi:hypothetical protein
MPETHPQEFGPQIPTKEDMERLASIYTEALMKKDKESPEAIAALADWIDSKFVETNSGTQEHPRELGKVRLNIALGILFLRNGLAFDAKESLNAARLEISNIQSSDTEDYEYDIELYLHLAEDMLRGNN